MSAGAVASPEGPARLSHRRVWAIAGPILLSNLTTPLVGAVDTGVAGHLGAADRMGAVAVGAVIFNFLYWGLGFLRMGTTGLAAQALGAGDRVEARAVLGRALVIAGALGGLLVLFHVPVRAGALALVGASPEVAAGAALYFTVRIWAAPAALANFALFGWFIGVQRARSAFTIQVWLNGSNALLALGLVFGLHMGLPGIALATALAEASAALLGLVLARRIASGLGEAPSWTRLREPAAFGRAIAVNRDIFLRTLCLIAAFVWFTARGARQGDVVLAANALLMQLYVFAAYGLDAFAFATEALVGEAMGRRSRAAFRDAVRLSGLWAAGAAGLLAAVFIAAGPAIVAGLTDLDPVRREAMRYLPWTVAVPLAGVWCFQLDGIFIGATRTADMRNAMLVSTAAYFALWALLAPHFGNHGLWAAFVLFLAVRGVTLAWRYPALERSVTG